LAGGYANSIVQARNPRNHVPKFQANFGVAEEKPHRPCGSGGALLVVEFWRSALGGRAARSHQPQHRDYTLIITCHQAHGRGFLDFHLIT